MRTERVVKIPINDIRKRRSTNFFPISMDTDLQLNSRSDWQVRVERNLKRGWRGFFKSNSWAISLREWWDNFVPTATAHVNVRTNNGASIRPISTLCNSAIWF